MYHHYDASPIRPESPVSTARIPDRSTHSSTAIGSFVKIKKRSPDSDFFDNTIDPSTPPQTIDVLPTQPIVSETAQATPTVTDSPPSQATVTATPLSQPTTTPTATDTLLSQPTLTTTPLPQPTQQPATPAVRHGTAAVIGTLAGIALLGLLGFLAAILLKRCLARRAQNVTSDAQIRWDNAQAAPKTFTLAAPSVVAKPHTADPSTAVANSPIPALNTQEHADVVLPQPPEPSLHSGRMIPVARPFRPTKLGDHSSIRPVYRPHEGQPLHVLAALDGSPALKNSPETMSYPPRPAPLVVNNGSVDPCHRNPINQAQLKLSDLPLFPPGPYYH